MAIRGRPRLLVLRALGLGDLLAAVPALRALASAYPDHRRTLAAPQGLQPLIELLDGAVTDLLAADFRHGVGTLPPTPADVAVNLHGVGPQSHRALLRAGARRLLAYRHPVVAASGDGPPWTDDEHEVVRWCRLLGWYEMDADPAAVELRVDADRALGAARGSTLIHPGAASPARRWPPERWAEVARREGEAGRRVVVTGGSAEVGLARRVADGAGLATPAVLAGRTALVELMASVAVADRVLCGDTGVAHIATATGTPSVVLFGPTAPSRWGPPAARGRHRALWAGRTGDPHATRPDPGLLAITVDAVCAASATLPMRAVP